MRGSEPEEELLNTIRKLTRQRNMIFFQGLIAALLAIALILTR